MMMMVLVDDESNPPPCKPTSTICTWSVFLCFQIAQQFHGDFIINLKFQNLIPNGC